MGEEGDDRGWDGWMASPTWWTWVWASSGSWWWIGKPGVLQSTGLAKIGHDWVAEVNWEVRTSIYEFWRVTIGSITSSLQTVYPMHWVTNQLQDILLQLSIFFPSNHFNMAVIQSRKKDSNIFLLKGMLPWLPHNKHDQRQRWDQIQGARVIGRLQGSRLKSLVSESLFRASRQ